MTASVGISTRGTVLPLAEIATAVDPERLHLIIMPTEKCNFRCTYCYETFAIGRMSTTTRDAIIRLVERRAHDLKELAISWFGGEPLLAADIIDDISTAVQTLNATGHTMRFRANITTNGYLLGPSMMGRMLRAGVTSYQISLDGIGVVHDATRHRADGSGTFATIWANLLALHSRREDFSILLRLHVHPNNERDIRELAEQIRLHLLDDSRFAAIIRPVEHLGGPNDTHFAVLDNDRAYDVATRLAAELGLTAKQQHLSNYICYAAKANSLIIRANGTISKCTVAMYDPLNIVGRINDDGTLSIDASRFSRWMEGVRTGDKATLECPNSKIRNTARGEYRPAIS